MIQIYMGEGKGKTTAAVGLSIRAVGHGKRVYFAQFMKVWSTGELFGLLDERDILELMEALPRAREKELVLTGRDATETMIQKADLVSHIQKIKHYFNKGMQAREGIEF